VSICDVYDALRSQRVYKDGWGLDETTEELHRESGKKFDPELVDLFLKILPNIQALGEKYSEGNNS